MRYRQGFTPFWGNSEFRFEPAMDRFFARATNVPVWSAGADVRELDDRAEIVVDVPGVKPDQIEVTAEHRTITLKIRREGRPELTRQYTVGSRYDIGKVEAKLELGVLTLTLPKAAEAQARMVPVTVA